MSEAAIADKRDLWFCWWVLPFFYSFFGLIFVLLTRVMPPPSPHKTDAQIATFFHSHTTTIQIGFAILMVVIGGSGILNGFVAYEMKRMSVNPAFAYTYIATLAVGAIPGCLMCAFSFLAATFRPDRNVHIIAMLYDVALLTFVGSLGCFATQYLVLGIAVLLDKNQIFPKWFAYVSFWNVITELLAAPVFVFKKGPFSWNGAISFWEGTVIFVIYLNCFILLLRKAVQSQGATEVVAD
ncbi:MAG TPA: hypothetical protein VHC43_03235 [Mycobacteriales bacterium]|nr:hypothetical protein [Mycobacteriales bacterium]